MPTGKQRDAVRAVFRDVVDDREALIDSLFRDCRSHFVAAEKAKTARRFMDTAAGGGTQDTPILGPYDAARSVQALTLLPMGSVIADADNYAVVAVKVNDGAGGQAVTLGTLTTQPQDGDWIAGKAKSLTIASTHIPRGGVIWYAVDKPGTGVQLPAFRLNVEAL